MIEHHRSQINRLNNPALTVHHGTANHSTKCIYKNGTNHTTQDKSQWIVGQSLLSHLQYPDAFKSSAKDLSFPTSSLRLSDNIHVVYNTVNKSPFELGQETCLHAILHVISGMVNNTAYPAWIPT